MNKISIGIVLLMSMNVFAVTPSAAKLTRSGFGNWPRARADVFGCFLEKEFGFKDKKFNCSLKDYHNHGDPCKNVDAYVEGPEFPLDAVTQVGEDIKSIQLAWEHGDLQSVAVEFQGKKKLSELKKYHLPSDASLQDCTPTTTCAVVEGFDHLGAGDAGCE